MIEIILYCLIFLLILLQSLVGVGVLLIGTPLLLIFGFDIISTISILLPISITTSLINLLYFYYLKKKNLDLKIDKEVKKSFFFFCIPFIFIGTLILKYYNEIINFNYLVSIIIFFTILISNSKNFLPIIKDIKMARIFLATTGVVHGLTNSGGSLISIFISLNNNKNLSRYGITFYYFFLAFFQFLIFIFFFEKMLYFYDYYFVILSIPIAVWLSNTIEKFIKENFFKNLIKVLAIVSSVVLILS